MKPAAHHYEDKLLEFAYGELPKHEADAVDAHVRGCARCAQALGDIRGVRSAMANLPRVEAPDAGLESLLAYAEQAAVKNRAATPQPWWSPRRWLIPVISLSAIATVGVVGYRATNQLAPTAASVIAEEKAQTLAKSEKLVARSDEARARGQKAAAPSALANKLGEGGAGDGLGQEQLAGAKQAAPRPAEARAKAGAEFDAKSVEAKSVEAKSAAVEKKALRDFGDSSSGYGVFDKDAAEAPAKEVAGKPSKVVRANELGTDWSNAGGAPKGGKSSYGVGSGRSEAMPEPSAAPAPPAALAPPAAPAPRAEPASRAAQLPTPSSASGGSFEPEAQKREGSQRAETGNLETAKNDSLGIGSLRTRNAPGRAGPADDAAEETRALDEAIDRKSADSEASFDQRRQAVARGDAATQAEIATKKGDVQTAVARWEVVLGSGATGGQRLSALSGLCDGYTTLGQAEKADAYCDQLLREFPSSRAAEAIGQRRGYQQRAPAIPAKAKVKTPARE